MAESLMEPKITAIAPWFGGKRNLASEIVAELGPHGAYWEPFCGSMAILFAKDVTSTEVVNDKHGELINLARCLKDEETAVQLHENLMRCLMHEGLFHEAAARWKSKGYQPSPEVPDVLQATDFMVCSWFGRNGVAGTLSYNQGFCVRYTSSGGQAAKRWQSTVDSIPAWHHRLRGVTILNRDAMQILEKIEDSTKTAIYCDPPYIVKGAKYIHDFAVGDHQKLADLLNRFKKARVVVSYYDHESLDGLYPGWTKRRLQATKALVNQGMRDAGGTVDAPEVLLVNGPSLVEKSGSKLFE